MNRAVSSARIEPVYSHEETAQPRRRRKWIVVVLLILAAAAFVPIRLDRLKKHLEASISASVGRRVSAQRINFHLLPQPGFDLANFSIEDDPSFSSEPLLRSDSVTANLRLRSLLGARLEIARLSLKEPSLNLVRNAEGRWNVESLLARAAQIPSAPTATAHAEWRPRFPYIEADSGRINFKIGPEKRSFALAEADFSLWLATENVWSMRLAARPIRTDANLGDTGTLRLSGSFQRAADLHETPFRFDATWQRAQLGQLTELIYGRDRGWRGAVTASAKVVGTPHAFDVIANISVDDFRRYDIARRDLFDFNVNCNAGHRMAATLGPPLSFECTLPKDGGAIKMAGGLSFPGQHLQLSALSLRAIKFPLSTVAALARHMKKDMAPDLEASGLIDGTFFSASTAAGPGGVEDRGIETWTVVVSGVTLRSERLTAPTHSDVIAIRFQRPIIKSGTGQGHLHSEQPAISEPQLTIGPFRLAMGGPAPATASATFSHNNYLFEIKGDVDLRQFGTFLESMGLPNPEMETSSAGKATVDLTYRGAWSGFTKPEVTGTIRPQVPVRAAIK